MDTQANHATNQANGAYDTLKNIMATKYKNIPTDKKAARVSRRLLLANRSEQVTVVCAVSGIVSLMDIPAIPGYSLIWESPLSEVSNCRGIVQQGLSYLRSLDTQILAGLLIVIGDDYNLFRYQPEDSAAQKNAIIRTAGKDTIINALLMIEDYVHSANFLHLPSLSLILDPRLEEGGIAFNMTEWLKLVASLIIKNHYAEEDTEDSFYQEVPKKTISVPTIAKADKSKKKEEWALLNKKWAEQRVYKEDCKAAKNLIRDLVISETISAKLVGLLKSVFVEDALLTMDLSIRNLLACKLESFDCSAAGKLITIIRKEYPILREENLSLDLEELEPLEDQGVAACASLPSILPSILPQASKEATETAESSKVESFEPDYSKMSLVERIRAKKAFAASMAADQLGESA